MSHNKKQKTSLAFGTSLFVLGTVLLGCENPKDGRWGKGDHLPQQDGSCFVERFPRQTKASGSLDLLFIADSSNSLDDDRGRIASGIDSFVAQLPPSVDYRIGVMLAHGSRGAHSGRLYSYRNTPIVLDSQAMSLSKIRNGLHDSLTNLPEDYWADGGEEGLYSLYRAMDQGPLTSSRAKGFFREDAALAVVFIADENDICADYPAGVKRVVDPEGLELPAKARDCQGINPQSVYDRLKELQGSRPLIVSGILYSDRKTVPTTHGQDEYGYGYMELIQLAGGVAVDIAKGNYDQGLSQIAQFSVQQMQPTLDFHLSQSPVDSSTIAVRLLSSDSGSDHHGSDSDECQSDDDGHGSHGSHGDWQNDWEDECSPNYLPHHDEGDWEDSHPSHCCKKGDKDKGRKSDGKSGGMDEQGRLVDFTFDDGSNIVHLLDESAQEPVAEISYCLKVQPSPTPSPSTTASPEPSPSVTAPAPSPSPSVDPSPVPSPTVSTPAPSPSPTADPSPVPSVEPSPVPSVTVTPSPSPTVDPSPVPSPTVTTPAPSPTVDPSPAPSPTQSPVPSPSPTVTDVGTPAPSPSPTDTGTPAPSPSPTGCTGPFCGGGITGT